MIHVLEHVVTFSHGVEHVQSIDGAHHSLFRYDLPFLGCHLLLPLLWRYILLIFAYGGITAKILDILFWKGIFFL